MRVDKDVEAAQALERVVEAAAEVVAVGEVGPHRDAADLGRRLVRARRTAEDGDRCAGVGERPHEPTPDPAAAARDESAPPGQVERTGCHAPAVRTSASRAPSSARMRAVSRYASSTSSTIRSDSGTRSSSTDTVPV